MFCLPQGVKRGRYKNMILKVTPVFTKLNLITVLKDYLLKRGCIDQSSLILNKKAKLNVLRRNKE